MTEIVTWTEEQMYKTTSNNTQKRVDAGKRATPGPRPMFKKEAAKAAKRLKRKKRKEKWAGWYP